MEASERIALRDVDGSVSFAELSELASTVGHRVAGYERAAVWATPSINTAIAVVGALLAKVAVVPLNPKAGGPELQHVLADSRPDVVIATAADVLPRHLGQLHRVNVGERRKLGVGSCPPPEAGSAPAFIIYTSGTTGKPKGVVLSRDAVIKNLDALAEAWAWTGADVVGHSLPLFHAHGLILGVLGPLRRGGEARLLGRFDPKVMADAIRAGTTMLFGVPTMYRRLVIAAEADASIASALAGARILVSGSAPLARADYEAFERLTGQQIVERYGISETLIVCSGRIGQTRSAGSVGPPLAGVCIRIVDESGSDIPSGSDEPGEVLVRSDSMFSEYLNQPDATAQAFAGGWFRTGDVATRTPAGSVRIVGRLNSDVIKTGGYKVAAGEVEAALASHDAVAEVAVTGEADPDLGQRIAAWVVPAAGCEPSLNDLVEHVADLVAPHKRPRVMYSLSALPRNALGKVLKAQLGRDAATRAAAEVPSDPDR